MIVFVEGNVFALMETAVDVNVHGVGYRVFITESLASQLKTGERVFLFTYQHLREDAAELYGFLTEGERVWFELLLDVSGIGPKGALQIVSASEFDEFLGAIGTEDVNALCRLPGVGKKTAQRMILELKDKVKPYAPVDMKAKAGLPSQRPISREHTLVMDIVEGLQALGYNEKQAEQAAAATLTGDHEELSVEGAIRRSLQWLSPHQR